ncbi:putative bifunctional diguanylate cyclase/phosphodiesterase [Sedimenticola hydrogenitrophicus]|uniref:putative bifunctional diguanylate cyclase/phosphodiesterase n=1 Tax=Sedimenticola hydrogenitrophicus TaxID=2967975 RepID=UPI0023B1F4AA|nr:EAL domain-containing protein [Sedimenticola hydrogenitrophicus]
MHKLLTRQLRRHLPPEWLEKPELRGLLEAIDIAYAQHDQDRTLLERAMDLSSGELTSANKSLKLILDSIPDDIYEFSADKRVRHRTINNHPPFMLCHSASCSGLYEVFVQDVAEQYDSALIEVLRSRQPVEFEFSFPDGDTNLYYEARLVPVQNDRVLALTRDITKRKLSEEQIAWLAYHDSLTGLPNKRLFGERVDQAIINARRHDRKVAVLVLDLDGFKLINDTMGHPIGDLLLKEIAGRLLECLRSSDLTEAQHVARLGGDEFTILFDDVEQVSHITRILPRITSTIAQPLLLGDQELVISSSMGIAVYPQDGEDADQLIKNADAAMYHAKDLGKNNFQFFTEQLNKVSMERLLLETGLRRALEKGEFELYYQPQIDLASERLVGLEALLRWRHPELGGVPPDIFIPIAEESGQIIRIGEWVISRAIEQSLAWQRQGYEPVRISVNLSGKHLQNHEFTDYLVELLETTGIDTDLLGIEITESSLLFNREQTLLTLGDIKAMNIKLSMDDFGTGYSSLGYLKQFPIDVLKIDRSFIQDIQVRDAETGLVKTIIDMGHVLGMEVVAEGVETREQLEYLKKHGCDTVQGFFFSRPLPAGEIVNLLRKA